MEDTEWSQWRDWQRGVEDTEWRGVEDTEWRDWQRGVEDTEWRDWQRGVEDTEWRSVEGLAERGWRTLSGGQWRD
ncbi:unnamed protein product [Staurois parvus]|uniref:Uncharacterized protein n=1 Tax=Staurois parvus TaxID=386267 RepID=A0ABN9DAT5_9NEOB|nr:unnamed protein product [Staurois parvus]